MVRLPEHHAEVQGRRRAPSVPFGHLAAVDEDGGGWPQLTTRIMCSLAGVSAKTALGTTGPPPRLRLARDAAARPRPRLDRHALSEKARTTAALVTAPTGGHDLVPPKSATGSPAPAGGPEGVGTRRPSRTAPCRSRPGARGDFRAYVPGGPGQISGHGPYLK